MQDKKDYSQEFLKLLLPHELFHYFEIINLKTEDKTLQIYLDEKNIIPEEFLSEKLSSKGFHSEVVIQDFPIRDKKVFLHVRRRRWLVESTNKVVSRDWNTVAKGTRLTGEFAAFLKGLFGYLPNKF
jgi:hypothetical protein